MIALFLFLMLIICGTADIIITSYHIAETLLGEAYNYCNENTRTVARLFVKLLLVFVVCYLYIFIAGQFCPKLVESVLKYWYKILNTLLDRFSRDD